MNDFIDVTSVRTEFLRSYAARDGVSLSADLYYPAGDGRFPVLITRTPYDNNRAGGLVGLQRLPAPADLYKRIAARGFLVVAGDVRGRGDSEGSFIPFAAETADGADTVDWARELPACNGRVGVFGSGYAAYCGWAAAVGSKRVDAIAAVSTMGAPDSGMPWHNGALRLDPLLWMHLVGGRTQQPVALPPWSSIWQQLPAADLDDALGRRDIWWRDWVSHPDVDDPYWEPMRQVLDGVRSLELPGLHVGGRWDANLASTLAFWQAARASPGASRQRLVVGPWDSRATRLPTQRIGGFDWTPASVLDLQHELLDFFVQTLHEEVAPDDGRTRVFVTGRNAWSEQQVWPPQSRRRAWWLASAGAANTNQGDGRLADTSQAVDATADSYLYDPGHPLPWQPRFGSFVAGAPFRLDESHIGSRDDVLCYLSEPADSAVLVTGRPTLILWAQTDAVDTDWVVTLADVFPGSGRSLHLAHGIVRAGSQPGFERGTPVEYTLVLTEVAHELRPGHRLRVSITSSLFPLYARNTNVADPYWAGVATTLAAQQVLHDQGHPSRLEIDISPNAN